MKQLMHRRWLVVVVIVILLGGAAAFFGRTRRTNSSTYFTAAVERGPLRNVVNATGVVQTVVTVQVGSQVSGQVQELYADFNSIVKRGQLLAKLDPRNFEAQVQNARANVSAVTARVRGSEAEIKTSAANLMSSKANLESARVTRDNAETQYQRAADLAEKGLASRNDLDNAKAGADSAQAKYEQAAASVAQVEAQGSSAAAQLEQVRAQLDQAQADLERARLNLEYCNIFSPVDGVVISRTIDVGQTLAASMQAPTLFTIANDLTRMQVNASVDEADIGIISAAQDVHFSVDAYPNEVFKARIAEIRLSPQTIQNVVTYSVILSIDNGAMKLRPGMTANISITVDQRDDVIKVANAALRYTPPGVQRPPTSRAAETTAADQTSSKEAGQRHDTPAHLAPGQKWDPSEKIQFGARQPSMRRQAIAYVLDAAGKPDVRQIEVGMTDGAATEVLSGLKAGDAVIIGDSSAAAPNGTTTSPRIGAGLAPAPAAGGGQRRGL